MYLQKVKQYFVGKYTYLYCTKIFSMFLSRKHFLLLRKIKDFLKWDQRWRRQQWKLFASASDFLHFLEEIWSLTEDRQSAAPASSWLLALSMNNKLKDAQA